MAPRTAKSKKATSDIKVTENIPAKKGRKGKQNIELEEEAPEIDVDEKMPLTEKKTKKGKKNANDEEQVNGSNERTRPPAKKTKKNNIEEAVLEEQSKGDNSAAEEEFSTPADENEQKDNQTEANGVLHSEEQQEISSGRGRKKQPKKEITAKKTSGSEPKSKNNARNKKNIEQESQENDNLKEQEATEEKSKVVRGREKKAQAKVVNDSESDEKPDTLDEVKLEPQIVKGRKKGQTKVNKEKTPEADKDPLEDQEISPEEEDDKVDKASKKKERKRNQAKKVQSKEEPEEITKKRRGAKKEEKGDFKEGEKQEKVSDIKVTKGKRGQKNTVTKPIEIEEEVQDTGEPTTKRRRKPAEEKVREEAKKKAPPKNKTSTNYEEIDFSNTSKSAQGKEWNFKISSWNVDGIRAWLDKGGLDYVKYEKPDILCLQEVKCAKEKLPREITNVPGYHAYWLCSDVDGYAGVGIYTTRLAMNVQYGLQNEELDSEGRIITAEYEQFYLVCTYVPNAGRKLVTLPKRLKWNEEFRKYVKALDKKKPVIICGDMNVSHNEIDLANPKTNKKNAGFTVEERAGMTDLLGDGFIDTFRHLNPEKTGAYTFWTYMSNSRSKNVGWRLDYFIISERLLSSLCDSIIRDEVYGSDHCPITILLHLTSADKPKE